MFIHQLSLILHLVSLPGEPPHHPRPGNIIFMPIKPRPRVRSNDNTPRRTPTRTPSTRLVTPSHTPPGFSTPGNVSPQVRVFNILLRTKLNILIEKRENFSSEDDHYRSAFFSGLQNFCMVFRSFPLATTSNRLRDLALLAQRHAKSVLPGVQLESHRLRKHEPG
jgi:hypothetical protein